MFGTRRRPAGRDADRGLLVAAVTLARAFGLAPYWRNASTRSGAVSYRSTARSWRALSLAWVLGNACYSVFTQFRNELSKEADLTGTGAMTHLGSLAMCLLQNGVFCWCLARRQYPGLLRVINSLSTHRVAACSGVTPFAMILVFYMAGVAVNLWPFFRIWVARPRLLLDAFAFLFWSHARTVELALFTALMSCLAARFRSLNRDMRLLMQGRQMAPCWAPGADYTAAAGGDEPSWRRLRTPRHSDHCARRSPYPADRTHCIRGVVREHRRYADLTQALAHCFGLQVLVDLAVETTYEVGLVFRALQAGSVTFDDAANVVKSFVSRGTVILVAGDLSREGNNMISTAHSFRNLKSLSNSEKTELEDFAESLCQMPLRVTLVNLVDLNAALLLKAGAIATTCLVVLMQF